MSKSEIERADIKDALEILVLQKIAYESEARLYKNWNIPPLTQTVDEIAADFNNQTFLVLKSNGRIVGSVRAEAKDGICQIGRLIVHPDYQRQGIGRSLMKAIENEFDKVEKFQVFTGEKSIANIAHYESHGYQITGKKELSGTLTLVMMEKLA